MKNNRINTTFFNFRLFLEALKRLRVIGLGTAILALTVSALVPAVTWIEEGSYTRDKVYEMDTELLCVPAGAMVILAPLFFAVLFSFLQKRKESDFFHAIPYTRTCVYISFVTAALAFIWVIQLACGVTAGILWSMIPRLAADIGGMFTYVGVSMLAAAMLSAFMMLALTVSGTSGSCTLLFLLFTGFVRVVCAIFLGCMDTVYFIDTNEMWNVSLLSPLWFLPLNVIYYWGDLTSSTQLLYSLPNILYSLAVTLGLFSFAGLLYNRRKSEMAGNPAPGVKTQALFRIMFTSLAVLLIPLLVITGDADAALMLVLVVGVLLVYFLYELITTKRPKNLLKIFPGLGIVAGVCVAFFLAYGTFYTVTVNETVSLSEIKWVSVESNGFAGGTYQDRLSDTLRTDDTEIVKIVVDRLAVSQQHERVGMANQGSDYHTRMNVTIRLKNGRTLHRRISMNGTSREAVQARFATLDEVKEIMYLLPKDGEIKSGGVSISGYEYFHLGDREQLGELLAIFRAEYEALTKEQKALVMAPVLIDNRTYYDYYEEYGYDYKEEYDEAIHNGVILSLNGFVGGKRFGNEYVIIDAMPKTRDALVCLMGMDQLDSCYFWVGNENAGGDPIVTLTAFGECAADQKFTETFAELKGSVRLMGLSDDTRGEITDAPFALAAEDYARFAELMKKACVFTSSTKDYEFTLTDGTYFLNLYNNADEKYANISFTIRGVFRFTPEEMEELKEMLQIEP